MTEAPNLQPITTLLAELQSLFNRTTPNELKRHMTRLVPEYKPKVEEAECAKPVKPSRPMVAVEN